ncbi:MAG: cytochrome-c peroxidase [Bacteroidota bacterium]
MKKTLYGFLSIALLMCIGFFQKNTEPAKVALERVAAQYKNSLDLFEAQINRYAEVAESFSQKKADLFTLQKTHRETRLALKEVEFLMSYLDPVAVKNFINGAPLPKPEPNIPELRAFEPKGLQVLDELVYGDEVFDLRDSISFQASTLKKNFKLVKNYTGSLSLEHRFVFEAIRQELIRVFTLGVTGFDTPGSSHALPEADISMQTISKVISAYYPMLSKLDYSLQQEMAVQFTQAIIYIKNHNNFETFNRLEFLTNFINPLYENVLKAQKTLGIEDYYEAVGFNTKLNHKGTNLFSDDFINAFTYSGLKKNEFTQKRAELGKILFFDPLLSANNEGACATCHNPDKGFADGIAKSPAMNGEGTILRNAPGLVNSVFAEKYFYDLREKVLARQIKHVVLNPKEFNTTFTDIED